MADSKADLKADLSAEPKGRPKGSVLAWRALLASIKVLEGFEVASKHDLWPRCPQLQASIRAGDLHTQLHAMHTFADTIQPMSSKYNTDPIYDVDLHSWLHAMCIVAAECKSCWARKMRSHWRCWISHLTACHVDLSASSTVQALIRLKAVVWPLVRLQALVAWQHCKWRPNLMGSVLPTVSFCIWQCTLYQSHVDNVSQLQGQLRSTTLLMQFLHLSPSCMTLHAQM